MTSREAESLSPLFNDHKTDKNDLFLLLSPSDKGVRLNKGRNGARYAPQAVINQLKKLNAHKRSHNIHQKHVFKDTNNFEADQMSSADQISKILQYQPHYSRAVHIGGGHDHAFPLIKAIESLSHIKEVCIINLDAHLDTRVDTIHHSGTPFRNLDDCLQKNCSLLQVGIQEFANSDSTMSSLNKIQQSIINIKTFSEQTECFTKSSTQIAQFLSQFNTDTTYFVLSLDMDAIDGSHIKAVSAVNPYGIPSHAVTEVLRQFINISPKHLALGVYEYNPVFEDLSNLGVRFISQLIYEFMVEA